MKRYCNIILSVIIMMFTVLYSVADTAIVNGIRWTYEVSDGNVLLRQGAVSDSIIGTLTIPSLLAGYPVTRVGGYAFSDCTNLRCVIIPNSVTNIGDRAFVRCRSLKCMTIPDSVLNIGGGAFEGCSDLTNVTISSSVKEIGWNMFSGCSNLTSMVIPNSVTNIEIWAFRNCSNLTNVIIPNSVVGIGDYVFDGCGSLTNVTIPNSVVGIGERVFSACSGLAEISVDEANMTYKSENGLLLSKDGKTLFYGRNGDVIIPNNVMRIKAFAFLSLANLTSVTIPDSVLYIEDGAFSGCSGLTSVTIPSRWRISAVFPSSYNKIHSVVLQSGSDSIIASTFKGCTALISVTIPETVKSIGDEAFYNCTSLQQLTLPAGIMSYGVDCFEGCPAYTLQLYRSIFGGVSSSVQTTVVQQVEAPYALSDHAADRAIASVTVNDDCAIDSFVLKDGKVYDSVLYISNTADRAVTLTLPSGYVYKAIKSTRPLDIPANSQSILSITRVADNVFLVSREDLETIQ